MLNNTFKTAWIIGATVIMGTLSLALAPIPELVIITTIGAFTTTIALIYILETAEKEANQFLKNHPHT